MKKTFALLLLLSATTVFAQKGKNQLLTLPVNNATKLITYNGVIQVEGTTKNDLYLRAREWFAKKFNSKKDVIQMDDQKAGTLIGTVHIQSQYKYFTIVPYVLEYNISITSRDGMYKYEISSITIHTEGETIPIEDCYAVYQKKKGGDSARAKRIIPQVYDMFEGIVNQLKFSMQPTIGFDAKAGI